MGYHSSDDWEEVEPLPGVRRRVLSCGEQVMVVRFHIADGAEVTLHTHPHEQVGHVIDGRLLFQIGDERREIGPGEGYSVPSGVPHGCVGLEETIAVDSFNPVREDYRL